MSGRKPDGWQGCCCVAVDIEGHHPSCPSMAAKLSYAEAERDAAREEVDRQRAEVLHREECNESLLSDLTAAREEVAAVIAKADRLTKEYLDRAQTAEAESARLRAQGEALRELIDAEESNDAMRWSRARKAARALLLPEVKP